MFRLRLTKTPVPSTLVILLLWNWTYAVSADFIISIAGEYANLLPADTALKIWGSPQKYSLDDLPLRLPSSVFADKVWYVDFLASDKAVLCSVRLSKDLFDKPRKIKILLNSPTMQLMTPKCIEMPFIQLIPKITQRMSYREIPKIDSVSKKLVPSVPPRAKIVKDGIAIYDREMGAGCFGEKWFPPYAYESLEAGQDYQIEVQWDSGGLTSTYKCTKSFALQPEAAL